MFDIKIKKLFKIKQKKEGQMIFKKIELENGTIINFRFFRKDKEAAAEFLETSFWEDFFKRRINERIKKISPENIIENPDNFMSLAGLVSESIITVIKENLGIELRRFNPEKHLNIVKTLPRAGYFSDGEIFIENKNLDDNTFAHFFSHEFFHWQSRCVFDVVFDKTKSEPIFINRKSGFCVYYAGGTCRSWFCFNEGVTEFFAYLCRLLISKKDFSIFCHPYISCYKKSTNKIDFLINKISNNESISLEENKKKLLRYYLNRDISILNRFGLSRDKKIEIAHWRE